MKGMSAPHSPSSISRNPLKAPLLRRICSIPAIPITSRLSSDVVLCRPILLGPYPEKGAVFRRRPGIVRDVDSRRNVPRTDLLLADRRLAEAERRLGRALVKAAVGRAQQQARDGQIAPEQVADAAVAELPARATALIPVINATGVLVHTNLGRAPLSAAASDAIVAAAGHCDVEFDLASGTRARRGAGALDALARAVPAAEAVAVVNNNAAALVLAATALTSPDADEIVVSRGELIEIGDRFRVPDLLRAPEAGTVAGQSGLVLTLTRHPLAGALRVDELTLPALEATLAGPVPPVAAARAADPASVPKRAERVVARLVSAGLDARVA